MSAYRVDPEPFVGSGWRTSRTKVIDNAIATFVKGSDATPQTASSSTRRPPDTARLANQYTTEELYDTLGEFRSELESAGLKPNTIGTYVGRSTIFVDWLAGRYRPRGPNSGPG